MHGLTKLRLAWGADPPDTKYGFEDEVRFRMSARQLTFLTSVRSSIGENVGVSLNGSCLNLIFSVIFQGFVTRMSRSSMLIRNL